MQTESLPRCQLLSGRHTLPAPHCVRQMSQRDPRAGSAPGWVESLRGEAPPHLHQRIAQPATAEGEQDKWQTRSWSQQAALWVTQGLGGGLRCKRGRALVQVAARRVAACRVSRVPAAQTGAPWAASPVQRCCQACEPAQLPCALGCVGLGGRVQPCATVGGSHGDERGRAPGRRCAERWPGG